MIEVAGQAGLAKRVTPDDVIRGVNHAVSVGICGVASNKSEFAPPNLIIVDVDVLVEIKVAFARDDADSARKELSRKWITGVICNKRKLWIGRKCHLVQPLRRPPWNGDVDAQQSST